MYVSTKKYTYLIINKTIPQKQIRTANTDKMFDNSATETNIAVIATSILFGLVKSETK